MGFRCAASKISSFFLRVESPVLFINETNNKQKMKIKFTLILIFLTVLGNAQIINFPDANFKAKLLEASSSNQIASTQIPDIDGYVSSYNTIDTNGDGEIQVSESLLIKYLNVSASSISNLGGISNFTGLLTLFCSYNQLSNLNATSLTNLQHLNCSTNQLPTLDVSSLTNLKSLDCTYNQLTSLNATSLTNLKVLDCSHNQLTNLNISGLLNLQSLICSANQLPNLDVNNLTNLIVLDCSFTNRTNLNVSSLTNLKYLFCEHNSLSNLNVSSLSNLIRLTCSYNQLTTLNLSGLTNLVMMDCSYNQLTTIGLNGLPNFSNFVCSHNQLTSLNVSNLNNLNYFRCENNLISNLNVTGLVQLSTLNCDANQLQNINLGGLTSLQEMHCANNQLAIVDVTNLTTLQGLDCSYNQLTNLDLTGTDMVSLTCSNNQISLLNLSGFVNLVYLACQNNQLTSLFIKNNNANLYDVLFEGNPNITYICSDEEDINFIQNKLNSYGYATTCHVNSYCSFTPGSNFYTIHGNNKMDENTNGCESSDPVYPNLKFTITDGTISGSLISNSTGNYSIPVSAGTHTITPQFENPSYFNVSPASATVTFPATTNPFTQDFCIVPTGVHHDLEVVIIPIGSARPGFDVTYKIKYKNEGVVSENGTVVFNYNEATLDYVSSSVAPTIQSSGLLSWNIGLIAPFQSGEIMVTVNVNSPTENPAVNAGDFLNFTATITGLNTDETPDDSTFALAQVVVNSFDPNDKTCLEGSTITPSSIGKYVHYKIKFENTGTFPAQNIVVKDNIDTTKFDISTLQMTDASHSCITRITNPDKVEFIFEHINLPFDDANNDGYVVFKIKTKPTLVLGNSFSNLASIYFDYNFPIVTNNYTTTIQNSLGTNPFKMETLTTFPNPVEDMLQFKTNENVVKIEVYDITGRILSSHAVQENKVDLSALKTGNYMLKVFTENGITNCKIIKE